MSKESNPGSEQVSPRGGTTTADTSNSPWWNFGFVAAAAAVVAAETSDSGSLAEEAEEGDGGGKEKAHVSCVRFEEGTIDKEKEQGDKEHFDALASMGFVDLVENLLLTHDNNNQRTLSIGTAFSEPDSEAESTSPRRGEDSWEWDLEEIEAFADQIHRKMKEQLEQEATFMDLALKRSMAVMMGALEIEDDTKMLIKEGMLAGLGSTPLDDEGQVNLRRIELSTLLTLTSHNYEQWLHSLCCGVPQPALSVRSSHRPATSHRLLASTTLADHLRSPLFKMHRELSLLGSTSSEESNSESDSDSIGSSRKTELAEIAAAGGGDKAKASAKENPVLTLNLPAGARRTPPIPAGVPRLHLGAPASLPSPVMDPPQEAPVSGGSTKEGNLKGSRRESGGPHVADEVGGAPDAASTKAQDEPKEATEGSKGSPERAKSPTGPPEVFKGSPDAAEEGKRPLGFPGVITAAAAGSPKEPLERTASHKRLSGDPLVASKGLVDAPRLSKEKREGKGPPAAPEEEAIQTPDAATKGPLGRRGSAATPETGEPFDTPAASAGAEAPAASDSPQSVSCVVSHPGSPAPGLSLNMKKAAPRTGLTPGSAPSSDSPQERGPVRGAHANGPKAVPLAKGPPRGAPEEAPTSKSEPIKTATGAAMPEPLHGPRDAAAPTEPASAATSTSTSPTEEERSGSSNNNKVALASEKGVLSHDAPSPGAPP